MLDTLTPSYNIIATAAREAGTVAVNAKHTKRVIVSFLRQSKLWEHLEVKYEPIVQRSGMMCFNSQSGPPCTPSTRVAVTVQRGMYNM